MKITCLIIATLVALSHCDSSALNEFANGNLKFTARLYNEILKANPNKNFIFSPFSIEVILALTRAGAKGITHNEFGSALNLPSEEATEEALKQYLPTLHSSEDLKLLSANRLFAGKKFQILDSFKRLATGSFGAGIENVDFGQPESAANQINQWVAGQTNTKIKDLISPDSIDALTRLVLVNALYFSGKWETPFEPYTRKEKFYLSNTQSKEVDMMFLEDSFKYYESKELKAKFIELPYLGGNVSMTVILPNEKEGLTLVEQNLESYLAPQNLEWQRVAVRMPSFLVESDLKLKPILKKLGLNNVFSDGADLSGIAAEPLKVDDVVQKAFINVTTAGTEAAAATAVFLGRSAKLYIFTDKAFTADHPFFYTIKSQGIVLFAGKIST